MKTVEDFLVVFAQNMCNVDPIIGDPGDEENVKFGVRIRPWNKEDAGTMVLAQGDTFLTALQVAHEKARLGRWEDLDWAKRPWSAPAKRAKAW